MGQVSGVGYVTIDNVSVAGISGIGGVGGGGGGGTPYTQILFTSSSYNFLDPAGGAATQPIGLARVSDTKQLVSYRKTNNNMAVQVVTHSDGVTTSVGSEFVISSNIGNGTITSLANGKTIAMYRNNSDSGRPYVRVMSVTGSSVTFDTAETRLELSIRNINMGNSCILDSDRFLIGYGQGAANPKNIALIQYSGGSLSWNTVTMTTANAATATNAVSVAMDTSTRGLAVCNYRASTVNTEFSANILTVGSGTTISVGTTQRSGTFGIDNFIVQDLICVDDDEYIVAFISKDDWILRFMQISLSGTTISYDTSNIIASAVAVANSDNSCWFIKNPLTVGDVDYFPMVAGDGRAILTSWDNSTSNFSIVDVNNSGVQTWAMNIEPIYDDTQDARFMGAYIEDGINKYVHTVPIEVST